MACRGWHSGPAVGLNRPPAEPIMTGDSRPPSEGSAMLQRKSLFPNVIEMNYQAGRRLGVNVYLIDGGSEFALIDIGYLDTVNEIIDLIRQMDFSLSSCKLLIATHADVDHIQGLARAREVLKAKVAAHPE